MSAPLKVFIGCGESGKVRDAFRRLGHEAWSCDLRRAEDGSNRHIIGDARDVVTWGWDLLIVAHPPCTRLCNSGVRWIDDPSAMKNLGEDFTDEERAAWPGMDLDAKAVFEEPGCCAVFEPSNPVNRWRGDDFEPPLRAAIATAHREDASVFGREGSDN